MAFYLVAAGWARLACHHRRVVTEFIEAVLDEWAGDLADVERNLPGVALRPEVETRLVPGLLTVDALLLEADVGALTRSLSEMAGRLDPVGYEVLSENSGWSLGESLSAQVFRGHLGRWLSASQGGLLRDVKEARRMPVLLTS